MGKSKMKPCPRNCGQRDVVAREVKHHSKLIGDIRRRTERVEEGLDFILNKVSANGHPGLESSLRDIHTEIRSMSTAVQSVLDATKTSRAWSDVRKSFRAVMKESAFVAIMTNKIGRGVVFLLLILVVNSLLHAIGVGLDVQSLLRTFRIIP